MRKLFLIFIVSILLLVSCGKKGDPVFNEKVQNLDRYSNQNIFII